MFHLFPEQVKEIFRNQYASEMKEVGTMERKILISHVSRTRETNKIYNQMIEPKENLTHHLYQKQAKVKVIFRKFQNLEQWKNKKIRFYFEDSRIMLNLFSEQVNRYFWINMHPRRNIKWEQWKGQFR